MSNTPQSEKGKGREYRFNPDEDETLREVGEDHEFELEDDVDPAERRHDPLRQPH
jgi:hypothetical protein